MIESWPKWPDNKINIFGPSGCGKTHLIEWLYNQYPAYVSVIFADNYYYKQDHIPMEKRLCINYDHPDAIEWQLLTQH